MGVMANEGTTYTAVTEPALIQQPLDQFFTGEFTGLSVDPARTDFCFSALYAVPREAVTPGISLSGSMKINKTEQRIFVNYSPGITVNQETDKRFLC
jgi:hypothetical protein